jgi:EpsI family protein
VRLRFVCATVLIGLIAVLLRGRNEEIPKGPPLKSFPQQLGAWTATDLTIDQETLDVLGPGDFLLRRYSSQADADPTVTLYIAYFPSQRAGDTIHSPKNCLPGAGWLPAESERIAFSVPSHVPFPVNRYVITKGDSRLLVLYWYWAHDRGVASEYWAKYYLIKDSIRMNRSDGALVRIMTAMNPGETSEAAQQRIMPFSNLVVPLLNDYIPR